MRLWMDAQDRMLTDEQLLRQIAHYGSLEGALEHGDVRLVSGNTSCFSNAHKSTPVRERCLSDYLEEG